MVGSMGVKMSDDATLYEQIRTSIPFKDFVEILNEYLDGGFADLPDWDWVHTVSDGGES